MDQKGRMFNDLILAISRNSDGARDFLDELNTSTDYNPDTIIKDILRPMVYTYGLDEQKWRDQHQKNKSESLYGDAERVIMDYIFSNDYLTEKKELVKNHSLWKEVNIDETFDSFKELGKYLHHLCFNEDTLILSGDTMYIRTEYRWIPDRKGDEINKKIERFIKRQEFKIKGDKNDLSINRPRLWKEARDSIDGDAVEKYSFRTDMFDLEMGRMFFRDGAYNWVEGKIEYGNHNTRIFKDRKCPTKSNPEKREELVRRFIDPFFTIRPYDHPDNKHNIEKKEYLLYKLARSISGLGSNKNPDLLYGDRDGGKSALNKLLMNAFGSYLGNFDLTILAKDNNNLDSDRSNAKWVDYETKRIAIALESPEDDDGRQKCIVLDGSKIKKICSNGDPIQYRHLRKETSTVVIKPHVILCQNSVSKISSRDANKKVVEMQLNTSFYDPQETPESERHDSTYWVLRDPTIEKLLNDPEVGDEFLLMLMEAFNNPKPVPEFIRKEKEEIEVSDVSLIKDHFVVGNIENDFVDYDSIGNLIPSLPKHGTSIRRKFEQAFGKANILGKRKGRKAGLWGIRQIETNLFE